MGDSLSVMSTSKRRKKAEIPIAVNRFNRIQPGGVDKTPEEMQDGQRFQSGVGDDRSLHQVCGSCSLHNGITRGDL